MCINQWKKWRLALRTQCLPLLCGASDGSRILITKCSSRKRSRLSWPKHLDKWGVGPGYGSEFQFCFSSARTPRGGILSRCSPRCTQDPVASRKPQGICSIIKSLRPLLPRQGVLHGKDLGLGMKKNFFFNLYFVLNVFNFFLFIFY